MNLSNAQSSKLVSRRYELLRRLGSGGFSEVWEAHDKLSNGRVALKKYDAMEGVGATHARTELTILRMHRLPGIVDIFDEGVHEGRPFIVMQLVDGKHFPGSPKAKHWDQLQHIVVALLETLARMHDEGVFHLDLKPANVLVSNRGYPTILDFNTAWDGRMFLSANPKYIEGTLPYVAPERLRPGGSPNARADLYSLGIMIYRSLAGQLPRGRLSTVALLEACRTTPCPPLKSLAPSVPDRIAAFVDSLVAIDPDARPASARAALAMLRGLVTKSSHHASLPEPLRTTSHSVWTQNELAEFFAGPERLFHLPSEAAAIVIAATRGEANAVKSMLESWIRAGIAESDGQKIIVRRSDLEKMRAVPWGSVTSLQDTAWQLAAGGDLRKALQLLHDGLQWIRRRGASDDSRQELSMIELLLDLAFADNSDTVMPLVHYEISRMTVRTPHVEQLEALAVAATSHQGGPRAFEEVERIAPFESLALERRRQGLRALTVRRCDQQTRERVMTDIAVWVKKHRDPITRARYAFWCGFHAYGQNDFRRAARLHAQAAKLEPLRVSRVSAKIAQASAELEVFRFVDAEKHAREALDEAKYCGSPFVEARAEWVLRCAMYRQEKPLDPDLELVDLISRIGSKDTNAMVCLTEAAFAYRGSDLQLAHRLATLAHEAWMRVGSVGFALLPEALVMATRNAPVDMEAMARTMSQAIQCNATGIGLQVVALLLSAIERQGQVASPIRQILEELPVRQWKMAIPRAHWGKRMDVLSVRECVEVIERLSPLRLTDS